MAIKASRLASDTRQRLKEAAEEPSEQELMEQEMAVAAMGAKHTEQQLLRASRSGLMASRAHQDYFMCHQNWLITLRACRNRASAVRRTWE